MQQKIVLSIAAVVLLGVGAFSGTSFMSTDTNHLPITKQTESRKEEHDTSPYAGQQQRSIKYLAQEDVSALKQGKGKALGGLAKPAELNSYPGPRHVLDLSGKLELSTTQKQKVQSLFEDMKKEAKDVGLEFLEVERQIDEAYAEGTMTDAKLERLLKRSGELYGELRYTHLAYHFQTGDVLNLKQIQQYDELRGYTSDETMGNHSDDAHAH